MIKATHKENNVCIAKESIPLSEQVEHMMGAEPVVSIYQHDGQMQKE